MYVSDFDRLRELCVTKPFRGTMLSVQKVQKSTKIQVHNIGNVDETMLLLYFESKRRSGGGEVADIQVFPQDDYAIIAFSECASKSLMKRQTADMSNSTNLMMTCSTQM